MIHVTVVFQLVIEPAKKAHSVLLSTKKWEANQVYLNNICSVVSQNIVHQAIDVSFPRKPVSLYKASSYHEVMLFQYTSLYE
jgi:hypothetical protein